MCSSERALFDTGKNDRYLVNVNNLDIVKAILGHLAQKSSDDDRPFFQKMLALMDGVAASENFVVIGDEKNFYYEDFEEFVKCIGSLNAAVLNDVIVVCEYFFPEKHLIWFDVVNGIQKNLIDEENYQLAYNNRIKLVDK